MADTLNITKKRRYEGVNCVHNLEPDYQNVRLEIPEYIHEIFFF